METINEQNFQKNNNFTKKQQNDEDQTFQLTSIGEQNYNKSENNINGSQKLDSIQKRKKSQSKLKLPFISPRESTRSIGGNKFFKFDTEQMIQQYKKDKKQQQQYSQEKKCTTEELNIKESYLARISTPITDLPVQSDNLNDDLYDLLNQKNRQDKKVLPARIITQEVDYYKNFKNLQRQNEKSTQYGLKPDLKLSILKPCLKNQTLLPKKLGYTFENLKFQKKFTLQNYNLEQQYIPMITQALKHDQLQKLEDFKLINNNIKRKPETLSKIIQALPKGTKEIQLQKNGINFEMTKILQPLLEGDIYSNLKVVNLSNNNLEDKGANQILFYMLDNSSIQSLDISANGITDKVIPTLKNLLQKSNYLNELYLSWNNITAIGGYQIATALEKNIELAVLDLSYNSLCHNSQNNKFAGVEIVKTITESVRSQMKHLDLSYNNLTKQEGQLINKIMKENKNVYGFHFEGNSGAFVNARQYIDFVDEIEIKQKLKKQESLNLIKKQPNNHKSKAKAFLLQKIQENTQRDFNINKQKIKSVKPLPLREGQVNLDSYNDICWICQGWHEVKFEFEFNVDEENNNNDKNNHIFVHLDFEGNLPILMERQGNIYVSYRMCPPNRKINFFFSNPITDTIAINDKYEKEKNTNFKDQLGQILEYPNGQKRLIEEPRTFNLQLPQKQMQIIDENSYEAKVKAQPRNNGYEEEFEIVPEWQFSQSIMYTWKPETEENLIQAFETDIQCSKIKKICKDEDDFEQIKISVQVSFLSLAKWKSFFHFLKYYD
ncbi:hypothetical protein PPERSA_08538 [Pseudocohnilembus persalinus]|uniref:Uncharacterized protein n=1 Tax=Pseudocohnilembus persalinus TaxID=266149 RepID=A0A0V0R6M1_PSEPJ|nr:hypothetical protein PPERSA_08538 [Pseudocohnilembus persalinus]|eukprot:KRX10135.1 hypothetical protein PPERSA_08538 [Pseudocohnilembus persalinus]